MTAIGIKMRTRDVESPAEGPMGFLLAERMIGTLYGVASTVCPGAVFLSASYGIDGTGEITPEPHDPGLTSAFTSALAAASAQHEEVSAAMKQSDRENL
ncbi:MAG TPA: hypothetical protein ENN56_01025 [Firmicutes bacterium]|nr:hypothetical protein [Bacillota bacterium]